MKSSDTKRFVEGITQYIQKSGKTSLVPKVTEMFGKLSTQAQKETVADITTSVPLEKDELEAVERVLFHLTGHAVTVNTKVDNSIIGGMKLKIGDWVVDTSFTGQIDNLGKSLL